SQFSGRERSIGRRSSVTGFITTHHAIGVCGSQSDGKTSSQFNPDGSRSPRIGESVTLSFMPTETLSDFLDLLDRQGELAKISARVDPKLEIAAICDRVCKTRAPHGNEERDRSAAASLGGKALLFQNVANSDIPVAINTFGSYWRI